jgi:transposase-like protein
MAEKETISLPEFQKKFSSEDACRDYLYKARWPLGPECPKCHGHKFYKNHTRDVYTCERCGHQIALTAGTVMEKHHTPLSKWFLAIYLVAVDKRGISAMELMRILKVRYQTAWTILHKIRKAMGDRDAKYKLGSIVELDESYFGGPTKCGKRGRGTEEQIVEVAVELDSGGFPHYAKMSVISDVKGATLADFAEKNIEVGSKINSDGLASYKKAFADGKYDHSPMKFDPGGNPEHLKWLHRIVSNAKTFILGTYHGLTRTHFQAYLDEFCYRLNRRKYGTAIFNRLLVAYATTTTIIYRDLIMMA